MKYSIKSFILVCLFLNSSVSVANISDDCLTDRAVFVFSSTSIVAKTAKINKCKNKILTIDKEFSLKIDYINSSEKNITQGQIYQILTDILKLKRELSINCNNIECIAFNSEINIQEEVKDGIRAFLFNDYKINYIDISKTDISLLLFEAIFANSLVPNELRKDFILLNFHDHIPRMIIGYNLSEYVIEFSKLGNYLHNKIAHNLDSFYSKKSIYPISSEQITKANSIAREQFNIELNDFKEIKEFYSSKKVIYATGQIFEDIAKKDNQVLNISKVEIINKITGLVSLDESKVIKLYNGNNKIFFDLINLYSIMSILNAEKYIIFNNITIEEGIFVKEKYWVKS